MNLSGLLEALPALKQPTFHCGKCELHYSPEWFHLSYSRCFFCMRFQSPHITRYALLYETKWYFIQSGHDDARTFYGTYFDLLHRWADRYQIPITDRDITYQTYLVHFVDNDNS